MVYRTCGGEVVGGLETHENINFKTLRDITKLRNGQRNLHFFVNKVYPGVRFIDGTIYAYSEICGRTIEMNEKHIEILK